MSAKVSRRAAEAAAIRCETGYLSPQRADVKVLIAAARALLAMQPASENEMVSAMDAAGAGPKTMWRAAEARLLRDVEE